MFQVREGQIAIWRSRKSAGRQLFFPGAIDVICPACGRQVSFTFRNWHQAPKGLFHAHVPCPACQEPARFMILDQDPVKRGLGVDATLWMHPSPKIREPISDTSAISAFSDPLLEAYLSTVKVFNTREWNATAILARRLLQGVVHSVLPESDHHLTLQQQMDKLPDVQDLTAPIHDLAEALGEKGSLGPYFELKIVPDEYHATQMLNLIDCMLQQLFVTPGKINAVTTGRQPQPEPEEVGENLLDLEVAS